MTDTLDRATPPAPKPRRSPEERAALQEAARVERRAEKAARRAEAEAAQAATVVVRPVAPPARTRARHWGMVLTFLLVVVAPTLAAGWYLYTRAADQFSTTMGFTVRSEDISSSVDILGNIGTTLGGGSASTDSDILYEFILSREIVAKIDARLDLRAMYSQHHDTDPLLSYDPSGTIEDLSDYWQRMVRVFYDQSSGLMELRVLAFTPQDAKDIAEAIFDESTTTINALSAIAREDTTRYAQEELDIALERLKSAREALTAFRLENQIVDVQADIQGQMGLLGMLQAQQAEALIELDLIRETARDSDPRVVTAERRLEVINARIAEERQKFGTGGTVGPGGETYANIVADFERLSVDREFAELSYSAALSELDGAKAEANRQSRYLAAYINPTLAEKSEFPQRGVMLAIVGVFAFLVWSILSLIYYSLRDRR